MKKLKKMNPKDKAVWVKALRSGKFKQGNGRLYNKVTDSYCCLGVASCVLGGNKHPTGRMLSSGRFGLSKGIQLVLATVNDGEMLNFGMFSETLKRHKMPSPVITSSHYDGHKKLSFYEIANYIDKYL